MKTKFLLLIFFLFTITFAETFAEAIVEWGKILFVLGMFALPPLLITIIIVGIANVFKQGAKLTYDLFVDDEKEEDHGSH